MIAASQDFDPALETYRARRDEASLRVLMEQHVAELRAVARRVVRRTDLAEDAVQEGFVRLTRSIDTIHGAAGPWLRTVVLHAALDLLRSEGSRRRCDEAYAEEAVRRAGMEALDPDVKEFIGDCIARLPERHRSVISRRFFLDMTQEEIAREAGISQVAVHKRLRAALTALRWEILQVGMLDCLQAMTGGRQLQGAQGAVILPDPASLALAAIAFLPRLIGLAGDAGVRAGVAAAACARAGEDPRCR